MHVLASPCQPKDRPRLEGVLFGLLLGPIGVVAEGTMATVKRNASATDEEEEDDDEIGRRVAEQFQPPPRK
jgi:hypothetical protein